MLVKHCPECREDYMPHVETCADCGAALVTRDDEGPAPDDEGDDAPALPPGDYRLLLASDRAAELDPLVARLAQASLPSKVEVGRGGFHLMVRDEDRRRAAELLHDAVGDLARGEAALERGFDAERGGYTACPACETTLPAGARECPECGLLLGEDAPTCAGCGAVVDLEAPRCGSCGQACAE